MNRIVVANVQEHGSYTPGKGSTAAEQGMQTIRAFYDKITIDQHRKVAETKNTVYGPASETACFDMHETEFAVSFKKARSESSEDKHSVHAFTSLNSVGSDIKDAYPHDEEMQTLALMNRIKYVGIVRDLVKYASYNRRQGVALQTNGVSTHWADNDMPPGCLVELYAPKASSIRSADRIRKQNVPATKVVLEARPYNPSNIEMQVGAVLRNYTSDPVKFKKVMDPKYRTTHAWINFCEVFGELHYLAWALVTDTLIEKGVIKPIEFQPTSVYNLAAGPGANPQGQPVILGISRALNLIKKSRSDGSDIPGKQIKITSEKQGYWNDLNLELRSRCLAPHNAANYGFGYDKRQRWNPAIDESNGKIKVNTPVGNMLHLQLNLSKQATGAMSDAVRRQSEWIAGKCVRGADTSRRFDLSK